MKMKMKILKSHQSQQQLLLYNNDTSRQGWGGVEVIAATSQHWIAAAGCWLPAPLPASTAANSQARCSNCGYVAGVVGWICGSGGGGGSLLVVFIKVSFTTEWKFQFRIKMAATVIEVSKIQSGNQRSHHSIYGLNKSDLPNCSLSTYL